MDGRMDGWMRVRHLASAGKRSEVAQRQAAMAGGGRCVCCEPDSALATSGRCMSAQFTYNPNLASFLFSFLVPPNRIIQESLNFI
jgi:hypothetical protein